MNNVWSLLLLVFFCFDSSSILVSSQYIPDALKRYSNKGVERDFEALLLMQQQQQQQQDDDDDDIRSGLYDDDDEFVDVSEIRELQENDLAYCYDALYLADLNKDSQVDPNEFVTFVQLLGPPGFLADAETFDDLPLIMQSNFIILACLCLQIPGSSSQCCTTNPHIDNTGTWPGQVPTPPQEQYLYQVCFLTGTSIDRVMASQTPTEAPVNPTDRPNEPPTPPPPTEEPSVATEPPTVSFSPTISPAGETDEPTLTKTPTASPVMNETDIPTASPVMNETMVPTGTPTTPDANVTDAPTVMVPTERPTPAPTNTRPSLRPPPTRAPSVPPTTVAPSSTPPPVASDEVAVVNYSIGIRNASVTTVDSSEYVPYLIESMDILAETIEEEWNANQMVMEEEGNLAEDPAFSLTRGGGGYFGDRTRRFLRSTVASLFSSKESTAVEENTRQLPKRRRLSIALEVAVPTDIVGSIVESCPTFVPESDQCQNVAASIPLVVYLTGDAASDPTEATRVKNSYQQQLDTAIQEGELQTILQRVRPDAPVYVTTGATSVPTLPPSGNGEGDDLARGDDAQGMGVGGIAGIVVGTMALVGIVALFVTHRRNLGKKGDEDDEVLLKDADGKATAEQLSKDIAAAGAREEELAEDPVKTAAVVGGAVGAAVALAAVSSSQKDETTKSGSPGKKKKSGSSSAALYAVPGAKNINSDEGSSVSESGWSSNQDMSSIDSKSLDSGAGPMYVGGGIGGAAALAAAAAVAGNDHTESSSSRGGNTGEDVSITASRDYSADMSLQSTYSELDDAIQKGDWAAVGVTAALLASQSQDDSTSEGGKLKVNKKASLNPQRAAELDALVEAGDWEGVVAAAARFDAQEALRGESSVQSRSNESPSAVSGAASISSTGTGPSFLSTSGTLESTTSPSTFTAANTATSDTASTRSKARKLNEIREEVEALVNAVVPEEADNVDEMMTQFRGREEELVETLRSMQERQVAQKARLESQKQAKRTAKAFVENQKQQEKFLSVDNTGAPADDKWISDIEGSEAVAAAGPDISALSAASRDAEKNEEAMKVRLQQAIANEDWVNVAEAAAGLSGHEIFQDDDTRDEDLEVLSTATGRSMEINSLVDKGDWDGIVAIASRYAEADSRKTEEETIEERRKRRQDRLKEEEEALAQAEIWDAIAQQTKAENEEADDKASNAGANLAAAWAIDRSLNALTKAEGAAEDSDRKSEDESGEEV